MKYKLHLLLLLFISIYSCKNAPHTIVPTPTPTLNFEYFPTDSAMWQTYYQSPMYDLRITVRSTNTDTFFNGYKYDIYDVTIDSINTYKHYTKTSYGRRYLRYDSINQVVTGIRQYGTKTIDKTVADFKPNAYNHNCIYPYIHDKNMLMGTISIEGVTIPAQYIKHKGTNNFFLARGVGSIGCMDVCPDVSVRGTVTGMTLKSLDFYYKSTHLHFEYNLHVL